MKVLCLSNLYPNAFQETRGNFVRFQVLSLVRQGCEISVVAPVPAAPAPLRLLCKKWRGYGLVPAQVGDGTVEVYHPRYLLFPRNLFFEYSGWSYYLGVKKLALNLHRDWPFDLIQAHTALPDGYAAMFLSRRLRLPFVVTIHGRDLQDTVGLGPGCRSAVLEVLKSADAVVNVSRKLADACVTLIGADPKIKVVNNGFDPRRLYHGRSPLRDQYGGCKVVLSVGSLRKAKGHDLTLRAMKTVKENGINARLLIIGGGEEGESLRRLAAELGLTESVELIPPLPHGQVMEYMSACDIFVLPSWNEGFGIVYLEAMANGKPVIAVRGQGISDVVSHGDNGLLAEPGDVESLSAMMLRLLKDGAYAAELGAAARDTVLDSFTWDRSAGRMMDIYAGLTAGN